MNKKLNQLRSTPGNKDNQVNNFTELNFKNVNVGGNKVAWTFFKVNLDEKYGQLGSREYPSYFYIRTESGNIYKIFRKDYKHLQPLLKNDFNKCEQVINTFPTDWCIYNPQTRKITAVENTDIKCGESFVYASKCTTSPIKEIVGVSDSQGGKSAASLKSGVEQEFLEKTNK